MKAPQNDNLFTHLARQRLAQTAPLADRMRPAKLEEFIGQEHILAPGRLLRRAIEADRISSLIFYGPPGTGKTTLARIIALRTQSEFFSLNAVLAGVKDIRDRIAQAQEILENSGKKSILFIDEVHRFNKSQQDALLPHVEQGLITLIGATTENPYFEVNKALVSRSRIFQLRSLDQAALLRVLQQALTDPVKGLGKLQIQVTPEAAEHLAKAANGDARAMLNALELAVITSAPDAAGLITLDLATAEESIQQKAVLYDKDGDAHFDHISAFIKSVRGSDVDAALYWLAKMVYAGEDPRFLFRRMIILAAEDVGQAAPEALGQVMAAAQAFDYVGLPEGRFHLAQACLCLCNAPKSNSSLGFFDALKTVAQEQDQDPPNHLKDASRDAKGLGHGQGYQYPHAYKDHWTAQQYLPLALQGKIFYHPSNQGAEGLVRAQVLTRREAQLAAMWEGGQGFKERVMETQGQEMDALRIAATSLLAPRADAMVLQLEAKTGWLVSDLGRNWINASLHFQVTKPEEADFLAATWPAEQAQAHLGPLESVVNKLETSNLQFDLILGKHPFPTPDAAQGCLAGLQRLLLPGGELLWISNLAGEGTRLQDLLAGAALDAQLWQAIQEAEAELSQTGAMSVTAADWERALEQAGLQRRATQKLQHQGQRWLTPAKLASWVSLQASPLGAALAKRLEERDLARLQQELEARLLGQPLAWQTCHHLALFAKAR